MREALKAATAYREACRLARIKGAALGRCLQRVMDNAGDETITATGGVGSFLSDFSELMDKFDECVALPM